MKISNIILLMLSFALFASCENESDSIDENNSFTGEWTLVRRQWWFPAGEIEDVEIIKQVSLEILSDSTVEYSDSLLDRDWHGQIINESGDFRIEFDDFSEYYYSITDEFLADDTLRSHHYFPIAYGESIIYLDTYIRSTNN